QKSRALSPLCGSSRLSALPARDQHPRPALEQHFDLPSCAASRRSQFAAGGFRGSATRLLVSLPITRNERSAADHGELLRQKRWKVKKSVVERRARSHLTTNVGADIHVRPPTHSVLTSW